ncbi:myosin light chain kinase, partial [Planoprotostelium fungivorum]
MPTRFHLFHTSRRSRADKQSLGDSPRDTVFQTYFPCNDSISSSSSNNSDTSVSTSDSSKGDDLSSSERTKMNKVLGEGPPASVTHSRAKSVTEDKGKGFFRSRTFPKENPSNMNQPAHETGSGVRVLSPELTHRLMHNTELRRSGARLAQKDIWVTSLTDDESFFHTLLKLPTEDKCLSPTLLKYFFMAHTFIIDSHALLAFLFNNYFDEKSTQQSRDRILVLLELWIQVSREDFKRIEVSFLFCNWHSLLFNSTVDGDKPKADRLKSVWERQELETYEPDLVRELSDREYDRKFSPKTIWDKLSEAHIACQMTLLDAQYFKKVRIYDLLQTDYSKHPDSTLVPLKNHFVKMSLWIASELISRPKKKKELLAKVLRVAELFLRMKNLNGVAYIVHALMLPVVARQQKMWKRLIDMPEEKIWTEISLLMERDSDGSYYWLNRKLRKTDGYFIPPFHVIMTELEEQADLNESIGLQNLPQVWRVGAILDYFQRNQSTSLSIRRDDKLQNFLHEMTVSNNIGKLWDVSKEVDPTPGFTPSADVENKLWYYSQLSPDEAEEILRSARPKSFIVWADLNSYCLSYTNRTLMVKHAHIDHKMAQAGTLRARQSSFSLMDVEHHNVTALVSRLPFLYDLRPILASNCAKNKGKMLANAPQMEHEFWNRCKHYGRADVFFSINAKLDKSDLEMLESQAAFSIASGDFETLGNLIGAGLPTTTKFEGNQTLLHIAAEKNLPRLIEYPFYKHHLQVIKSLLTHGARVSCLNNSGASPLHYVVRKKPETTEKKEGLSQLRKAPVSEAEEQFTAILNMLIERGAALNSQDFNGNTPLHSAINNSNEVAAKILLNRGALNQKNKRGDSSRTLAQARQVTGTGSWNSADPTMTDILLITEGSKMEKISDFKKVNSREVEQYLKQDLKRGVMPFDHHFSGIDYTALVGMDHETGVVLVFVAKEIPGQSTKVLLRHKKVSPHTLPFKLTLQGEELFLLERISPVSALRISLNMFLQGLDFKMTPGESLTRSILLSEKELHANATSVSILLVSEAAYNLRLVLADESKPSDAYTEFVRFMAGTRTRALSFGSLGADSSTREEKGMSAHAMVAYHPKHPSTSVVFYNIPTLPPEERKVQIQETPVIIVYLEASNIDTSMLLNHHAQTMIVVQPAKTSGEYRLAVVSRSSFGVYEPALPFPPIFSLDQDFKNYLFDKLINACVLASSAGFSFISEEFRDRALFEVYSASKNATTTATDFSNVPKHKMYKVYPSKIVGSGATSMVFQALNRQTKKEYCAKIVDKSLISTDEARAADKEVQILAEMSHQNVIKLIDSYTVDNSLYLVLELCRGGSIWEDVEQNGLFSEKQAANVMFQVMDALQYIHSRHISHRDLK